MLSNVQQIVRLFEILAYVHACSHPAFLWIPLQLLLTILFEYISLSVTYRCKVVSFGCPTLCKSKQMDWIYNTLLIRLLTLHQWNGRALAPPMFTNFFMWKLASNKNSLELCILFYSCFLGPLTTCMIWCLTEKTHQLFRSGIFSICALLHWFMGVVVYLQSL